MSAPRIMACRSHEDQSGPIFEIDAEEEEYYRNRPLVKLVSETGEVITTAHDLFEFKPENARRLVASWNAMRGMSVEEIEKMAG